MSEPGNRISRQQTGQTDGVKREIACQVAEFRATAGDLATRFALTNEMVSAGVAGARTAGLIKRKRRPTEADPTGERELLEPTPLGYELAGMAGWRSVTVKPGYEFNRKRLERHRRAVASVAAARGFLLESDEELMCEIAMRLKGRDSRRNYRFGTKVVLENSSYAHCPDLIVSKRTGKATTVTVTEILTDVIDQEELTCICKGWKYHHTVDAVEFYAVAASLPAVWRAVKEAGSAAMTRVYLLAEEPVASDLLEPQPESGPSFQDGPAGEPAIPFLEEAERKQLQEILRWIATWDVAGAQAIAGHFKLHTNVLGRLLRYAREEGLLESRTLKTEGEVYLLAEGGAQLLSVEQARTIKLTRRNITYLSRRSHIVALLAYQKHEYGGEQCEAEIFEIINPRDLGSGAPHVEVALGGIVYPWEADILMAPKLGARRPPIVVIVLARHESREGLRALCAAWHEHTGVARTVFYAIENMRDELREVIDQGGWGARLTVKSIPLSEAARLQSERDAEERKRAERSAIMVRQREEARERWSKQARPFVELSDEEWQAIEATLRPGRGKPRSWHGLPINCDRDVINTVLLSEHLHRAVKNMIVTDGYASGPMCLQRVRRWQEEKVWGSAREALANVSPERELPADPTRRWAPRRVVQPSRIFMGPEFKETLESDFRFLELLRRSIS